MGVGTGMDLTQAQWLIQLNTIFKDIIVLDPMDLECLGLLKFHFYLKILNLF